jgi:hypothetical protein
LTPIYSLALKTALDEIRNITPEVSCTFVFNQDGEVIAQDDNAQTVTIQQAIQFFNEITCRVDAVGGFENLTIKGSSGQVNFASCANGFYLATVSSKTFDEKTLFALNRVLVPVVIKVIDQLSQNNEIKPNVQTVQVKTEGLKKEQTVEPAKPEPVEVAPMKLEPLLPKAPVHQFMVEKISGLLVASDTVRIDGAVIEGWGQLYEGKLIDQVSIESLRMKTVTCKFKPIKEAKTTTKGIIQIPEKIMQTLELSKGELVMIKPVI